MEERLALIEVLERDGTVRARWPVARWPVRIGRAVECDVVLDDPHVAAVHAEVAPGEEGGLVVAALPSVNGVRLEKRRLAAGERAPLPDGASVWLGQTRLRVRRAGEPLQPERALAGAGPRALRAVVPLGLAVLGAALAELWLDLDPGARWSRPLLTEVLSPAILIAVWSLGWGLISKLFEHRFRFLPHLRLALWCALAAMLANALLHLAAFSLGWGWSSRVAPWVQPACLFALVRAHLLQVIPARARGVTRATLALCVAALGLSVGLSWQRSDRPFDEAFTSTVLPPGWRLAGTVAPGRFLAEVRALKGRLDRHAAEEPEGPGGLFDE